MAAVTSVARFLVYALCTLLYRHCYCLKCYTCPLTSWVDPVSTNLNCLANSTEQTCLADEDRCYSVTSETRGVTVQKGCTRSESCLGNRICCSRDFCNAGSDSHLKTGHGKACTDVSYCVQGEGNMVCSVRSQGGAAKVCRCEGARYKFGAVCRSMSRVGGHCLQDEHCLPFNSFCENNRCRCGHYFYANDTVCMIKVGLSAWCTEDFQCRPEHSQCDAGACLCKPGYDTQFGTGQCSACATLTNPIFLLFLMPVISIRCDYR
ncbi:uncharacterized protein [Haliotis cracherodii]|uniref:uncharacterized protein n=1 Tax=Haliotis cracherodii TaxID=6455 RepID=UPI0039EBD7BE